MAPATNTPHTHTQTLPRFREEGDYADLIAGALNGQRTPQAHHIPSIKPTIGHLGGHASLFGEIPRQPLPRTIFTKDVSTTRFLGGRSRATLENCARS